MLKLLIVYDKLVIYIRDIYHISEKRFASSTIHRMDVHMVIDVIISM
jgi:hypothetical protein